METINIKVIPNAKKNEVSQEAGIFRVRVTVPAIDGKANKALIEVLAEHFNVKKKNIKIVKGEKSREKVIQIQSGKEDKK